MVSIKTYCCVFILLLITLHAVADVTLPKVIGSNMVLQRNKPVAIWGKASPTEKIFVTFGKQRKQTTADASGKWMVHLDGMNASATPAEMIIKGNNTITLSNILVGEVWLCSGQSNMEFTMAKSAKYANAKHSQGLDSAATSKERNKNIRLFLVKRDLTKSDNGNVNKGWNEAEGANLRAFSAAGYYFAKNLNASLNIPIGIIASSVSGSNIDPWLNGTVNTNANNSFTIDETQPGKFFTGMIEPLAPFTLQGFLWYQGETNTFLKETSVYSYKFRHLINTLRSIWNAPNASFYFVQIAPFNYSKSKGKVEITETSLPEFREAQSAVLDLPNTGMIVTTDLVDNAEDIHPTYKWEIGRRLSLLALAKDYQKKIVYAGPTYRRMHLSDNKIIIEFDHAEGLKSSDGMPLTCLTIAGTDGKFYPANATIKGDKIVVTSVDVPHPNHVRFAWHEAAQPNLFNKAGLPAAPFRTDAPHLKTGNKY